MSDDGWVTVASSAELRPGAVLPISCAGRDGIVFRTAAGAAHALDAYCPHLGAHLGYGGTVVGEQVRCPFHHWRFDSSGRCAGIPYAAQIPPGAQLGAWPLREENGAIQVRPPQR
jgi:phenylpropionate dioxygenase-like ring-hydroxylating dioxygenase large terminal subunit